MEPTKQPSSDSIQWITEPGEKEPTPIRDPSPGPSKPVEELEKKVRVMELPDEEDEGYKHTPPQTEKDDNGFMFYKCRFCGLTFNFITTLKAHERVHDIEAVSNILYSITFLLSRMHVQNVLRRFISCANLNITQKLTKVRHLIYLLLLMNSEQKGYKCDCGRTFFQYTDLLYHYHPGEDPEPAPPLPQPEPRVRPFSRLPIDPAEFPTPGFAENGVEPKYPMRTYSEVRSKPYICQYCSKSYSDSRLVNRSYFFIPF
jgi:hypothetical protein